jgi:aspartyl/glutamyl-tRNA(Asn/Gln) amidotransferase C subunit
MKVTEKDVAYVADLANLELTAEERAGMVRDLNSILDYIDMLNGLDTSDVAPICLCQPRGRARGFAKIVAAGSGARECS